MMMMMLVFVLVVMVVAMLIVSMAIVIAISVIVGTVVMMMVMFIVSIVYLGRLLVNYVPCTCCKEESIGQLDNVSLWNVPLARMQAALALGLKSIRVRTLLANIK